MGGQVEGFAAAQHGVVTIGQLREELKLPPGTIRSLLERKELVGVHRGVYRLASAEPSWKQAAQAALLLAGPNAALSHASAALAHELEGIVEPRLIEVTVPETRDMGRPRGISVHVTRERIPATVVNGFQVTSLARTFVDLASVVTPETLEIALDHAHRRKESLEWLTSYLERLNQPRRAGLANLRQALAHQSGGFCGSPVEVEVRQKLRAHGLDFVLQFKIFDRRGYVMRVDFAFKKQRVAVHVDSRFHLTMSQLNTDAEQRGRLTALGWRQLVVTKAMLQNDLWIERLKELLLAGG